MNALVKDLKKSARSTGLVLPQQHPASHLGLVQDQPWVRRIYLQFEPQPRGDTGSRRRTRCPKHRPAAAGGRFAGYWQVKLYRLFLPQDVPCSRATRFSSMAAISRPAILSKAPGVQHLLVAGQVQRIVGAPTGCRGEFAGAQRDYQDGGHRQDITDRGDRHVVTGGMRNHPVRGLRPKRPTRHRQRTPAVPGSGKAAGYPADPAIETVPDAGHLSKQSDEHSAQESGRAWLLREAGWVLRQGRSASRTSEMEGGRGFQQVSSGSAALPAREPWRGCGQAVAHLQPVPRPN